MAELKSIEQLLHFMKGHIHLSRYDEKFIENIATLSQVTTNQVVLFHSLISKYSRQFAKHDLYPEKLFDLPWNVKVVESSPKYTDGHIEIVNNMIYFKCPFSRKFIDEFRKEPYNQFLFNNTERRYEAQYNQYSLKILMKIAGKHFKYINLCTVTQELIENVKQYENAKYWQPTLTEINERLYIVGMHGALNDALGDIELNTDLSTLSKLSGFGITIDPKLYDATILKENIACNTGVSVEQSDIKNVVVILQELGCDLVYIAGAGLLNIAKKAIIEELILSGIEYIDLNVAVDTMQPRNFPVLIKLRKAGTEQDSCKVCKVLHIVNSLPIDIK
jgi:hypothetical protein